MIYWTPLAKDCYQRNCRCDGCYFNGLFGFTDPVQVCKMKLSVIKLVKQWGLPDDIKPKGLAQLVIEDIEE